jgi:hypothetical protein
MKKLIPGLLVALVFTGAGSCDTKPGPVNIPTSPAPNGDPSPGGRCNGGPDHKITIDGKQYECYDRKWRPVQ